MPQRIVQQLRGGASFLAYARQFSEASTAAVGGDLGWVRAAQLPEALAAVGPDDAGRERQRSDRHSRRLLDHPAGRYPPGADRRSARRRPQPQADDDPSSPRAARGTRSRRRCSSLLRATQTMGGCGGAEAAAPVDRRRGHHQRPGQGPRAAGGRFSRPFSPSASARPRPPSARPTTGSASSSCAGATIPIPPASVSFEQVYNQLAENRVNLRARRFLRDLRRDAVVDYR